MTGKKGELEKSIESLRTKTKTLRNQKEDIDSQNQKDLASLEEKVQLSEQKVDEVSQLVTEQVSFNEKKEQSLKDLEKDIESYQSKLKDLDFKLVFQKVGLEIDQNTRKKSEECEETLEGLLELTQALFEQKDDLTRKELVKRLQDIQERFRSI